MTTETTSASPVRAAPHALELLLPSWRRALAAENKSPRTLQNYTDGVRFLIHFLAEQGMPTTASGVHREHIEYWLVALQERGQKPARVATRYGAARVFFEWLALEGEVAESPMVRMRPPAIPEEPVPVVSEDDLRRLLKATESKDFEARRDHAILRLFIDSGLRLSELTHLRLDDVDLDDRIALVMGKG